MGIFMTLHIFQIPLLTNQTGCVNTRFLRIYLVHCPLALIVVRENTLKMQSKRKSIEK